MTACAARTGRAPAAFAWRWPQGAGCRPSPAPPAGGGQTYTLSLQTLLLLTSLSFLPAALLMMTSFTRIIIVLSLLRHALGTQSSPPNQVLIGLALFLTLFVMGPTLDKIYAEAYQPLSGEPHPDGRSAATGAPRRCERSCCGRPARPIWPCS